MAFTKVVGAGIHTLSNIASHNINSSGIITATKFVGPFDGTNGDFSGDVTIDGNLTVNGTRTTLNTTLREVELLRVDANSSTAAGIITQRGSGDILNLYDGSTKKVVVDDQGNVGIKVTAPSHDLDVYLNGRFNQLGQGGYGLLVGPGTNTGGFTYMGTGDMEISCAMTNKDIVFSDAVGGNQRMRLTGDTGRLGIGTDSPDSKLNLVGSGSDANTRISIKDGVGISNVVGRYGNLVFQTDVDDAVNGSVMVFQIDGNEAFRVNDGRKIIIGNSGVAYGSGAVQSFIAHTANAATSGFNSIDTTSVAAGVGGEISFYGKFNTGAQDYAYLGHIRGIKENATAGNTACALTFHTRPTATAPSEKLRITSDGKVGIGTDNPSRKLDLHESSSSGNFISITNDTTGHGAGDGILIGMQDNESLLISNKENNHIEFHTNNVEKLRIDSAGNMSLGKASSASTAYTRQLQIHSTDTSGAALHLTNSTSGSGNSDGFHLVQQSHIYHWLREDAHQIFATNSVERLRITSTGDLSLRSTTQNAYLGLTANSTAINLTLGSTAGANPRMYLFGTGNGQSTAGDILMASGTGGILHYRSGGLIKFEVNSDNSTAEALRITSGGYVGINTTGSYPLDVLEPTNNAGLISITGANTGYDTGFLIRNGTNPKWYLINDVSNSHAFEIRGDGWSNDRFFTLTQTGVVTLGDATYGSSLGQFRIINDAETGSGAPASLALFGHNNTTDGTPFAQIQFAEQESGTGGQIKAKIEAQAVSTNERGADLVFFTAANSASSTATERVRIDSNGDINLGNNPTNQYGYKLNIQDNQILYAQTASSNGTELKLYLDHGNTVANFGTVSTSHLAFVTANTERLRITSGGAVQIDNSSGSTVSLTRTATNTSGLCGKIVFGNGNWDSSMASIQSYQDGANDNASLRFYTQASVGSGEKERLRITSGGNIGINSTSPQAQFVLSRDLSTNHGIEMGYSSGGGGQHFIQAYNRGTSAFTKLILNNSLNIDSNGKVGVDVSTPKSRLHLGASQDIRIGGQYGGMASMQQQVSYSSGYTGTHWQFKTTGGVSWSFDGVLIVHGTGGSSYGSEVVSIKIVYSRESGDSTGDIWRNGTSDYNIETLGHSQIGLAPSSGSLTVNHDSTPGGNTSYTLLKLGWSSSGQNVGVWSKLIGNFYWGAPSSGDVEIQDKDGNIVFNSNP